jgi:hypothetical protein
MKKALLVMLLAAGAFVSPAQANYFSNPYTGVTLNIGSAPNPTPADIRVDRLPQIVDEQPGFVLSFLRSLFGMPDTQTANADPASQTQPPSGGALVPAASQSR